MNFRTWLWQDYLLKGIYFKLLHEMAVRSLGLGKDAVFKVDAQRLGGHGTCSALPTSVAFKRG